VQIITELYVEIGHFHGRYTEAMRIKYQYKHFVKNLAVWVNVTLHGSRHDLNIWKSVLPFPTRNYG